MPFRGRSYGTTSCSCRTEVSRNTLVSCSVSSDPTGSSSSGDPCNRTTLRVGRETGNRPSSFWPSIPNNRSWTRRSYFLELGNPPSSLASQLGVFLVRYRLNFHSYTTGKSVSPSSRLLGQISILVFVSDLDWNGKVNTHSVGFPDNKARWRHIQYD